MADSGAATGIAKGIVKMLGSRQANSHSDHRLRSFNLWRRVSFCSSICAIYPISKVLFREANIPKRLIPATIALGSFTFSMTHYQDTGLRNQRNSNSFF